MRIGVTGSNKYEDKRKIKEFLFKFKDQSGIEIVCRGNKDGADKYIKKYSLEFGLDYIPLFNNDLKYPDCLKINHWLEQWYLTYNMLSQFLNSSQVLFVCYEELCDNNFIYRSIIDFIDVNSDHKFDFKLSLKEFDLEYDSELYNKSLNFYNNLKIQI